MKSSVKFSNLRAEMARTQTTIKQIAETVGVNRDTMGGKLSGKRPLFLSEAFIINRTFFPDKDIPYLFEELYKDDANKFN